MAKNSTVRRGSRCIVCGTIGYNIVVRGEDIRYKCLGHKKSIVQCPDCGFMWLFPSWTKKELDKLYDGYLDQEAFPGEKPATGITKYLTDYIKHDDYILEIGCGRGDNVKHLRRLGYDVNGIDKDSTYCDNFHIFHEDYKDFSCKVNFIYAIQVFEHIDNPEEFVKKIESMLTDKGRFLFEFPNADDPILTVYKNRAFKKYYYMPHHLYYWTIKTTKLFFNSMGMRVKIKPIQRYGIINHLRWAILGRPGNWNPHIPIIDDIYKSVLTNILKVSDTIVLTGEKR